MTGQSRDAAADDPGRGRRREVRETYDRIAAHFAETRAHPWRDVAAFLGERRGDVGLDVGVGNARHAELLAERTRLVVGLDLSRGALDQGLARARDRGFDLAAVLGDAATLPVIDDAVDLAVYVATLHHLPTREARVASLDELARVLAPAGAGLVSAWSTTHDRFDREEGFDTTVDWTLPDGETVPRFYHIYDPGEFRADLAASDLVVAETFESRGNCYGVVTAGE